MNRYAVHKPIWITEVGWSTALPSKFYQEVLPPVFRRAGIDPAQSTMAIVNDPANGFQQEINFDFKNLFPEFKGFEEVSFEKLNRLDPAKYPVLIPAFGAYLIPDLVGGPASELVGDKIAQRVFIDRNLPHASALSALLMLAVFLPLVCVLWLRKIQVKSRIRKCLWAISRS